MKSFLIVLCLLCSSVAAVEDFSPYLTEGTYLDMKISPDGKYIAANSFDGEEYAVVFLDSKTLELVDVMKFRYPDVVGPIRWVNEERVAIQVFRYIYRLDGLFNVGELFSMKVGATRGKFIFGYRAGKSNFNSSKDTSIAAKHRNFSKAWNEIIDTLDADPQHILVAATPWSAEGTSNTHIYKLNVEDGNIYPVTIVDATFAKVITDGSGNLVAAAYFNDNFETEVLLYDQTKSEWYSVKELQPVTDFSFQYYDKARKNIVFRSRFETDKAALYGFNIDSKQTFQLFHSPDAEVDNAIWALPGDTAYAVKTEAVKPHYIALNTENPLSPLFTAMVNGFKGHNIEIISASKDKKRVVFALESDVRAPAFYLFDSDVGRPQLIAERFSGLEGQFQPQMPFQFVNDANQFQAAGFVALPKKQSDAKVPTIVMFRSYPHAERYSWHFNRRVQMYTKQGYAVVLLDLPGADGYGKAVDDIGIGHWQEKQYGLVVDALERLSKNYPIDLNRVCSVGHAWGAYLAMMSAVHPPNFLKCVVADGGYYDFTRYREESFIDWFTFGDAFFEHEFGASATMLEKYNVEHFIARLNTPTLFIHGEYGKVQPISQVEDFKENMQQRGVPSELFEKKRTSRLAEELEVDVQAQNRIFEFLKKYLQDE